MTRPGSGSIVHSDIAGRKPSLLCLPVTCVAVVLAIGPACLAMADDSSSGSSSGQQAFKTVGHSTGKKTTKLKWLPRRPVKVTADRRASASHLAKKATGRPKSQSKPVADSPFDNHFGDVKPKRQPAASTEILGKQPTKAPKQQPQSNEPLPDEPLPDLAVPKTDLTPPATEDPSLTRERELAAARGVEDECPTAADFKRIGELTYKIAAEEGEFPTECPLTDKPFEPRAWAPTKFAWKASGLCHKPLYFEQAHLERYGHSCGPYLQPVISGGHFFLTVPALPYLMGLNAPNECMYTLGYYRPGSCAPYMLDPLPLSIRAALFEAGAATGLACMIP